MYNLKKKKKNGKRPDDKYTQHMAKDFTKASSLFRVSFPREDTGMREKSRNSFELMTLFPKKKHRPASFLASPVCKLTVTGKEENKRTA